MYEGSIVELLNLEGFSVAGVDLKGAEVCRVALTAAQSFKSLNPTRVCFHAGCGHSDGVRCYVDKYRDYVEDVLDFTRSGWVQCCRWWRAGGAGTSCD